MIPTKSEIDAIIKLCDERAKGYGALRQSCLTSIALDEAAAMLAALAEDREFQTRVGGWMLECFGPTISMDRLERRDRFVEESLELAQTLPAFTADRAHALVDYVFSRPVGLTEQEVGGASVTLAALCHAEGIDQTHWAEAELARINHPEIVEKIRAKQASKPTGSALPTPPEQEQ